MRTRSQEKENIKKKKTTIMGPFSVLWLDSEIDLFFVEREKKNLLQYFPKILMCALPCKCLF